MTLVAEPRRLCLVLERVPETVFEPEFVAEAPLIRFEAYADRGRIFGWVRLHEDRLTDLLNEHAELLLVNAEVEDLDDGRRSSADETALAASGARERLGSMLIAAFAQGATGMVGDIAGYCLRPWGFEPAEVTAKTSGGQVARRAHQPSSSRA